MKIKLEKNAEQIKLVKAMASKDMSVAIAAQEAFASLAGIVVQEVIQQASTAGLVFVDKTFNQDDSPSIPLDLYYDAAAGNITVWSQNQAGGLPSVLIEGVADMKVSTFPLQSAVSWNKKYIRKADLDVVAKGLSRLASEVIVKNDKNAWAVVLRALGEARTNGADHIITSTTQDRFVPHDLNRLFTLCKRNTMSYANGSPSPNSGRGLTDLFHSVEMTEEIRGMAYNPVNNIGTQATGPVTIPDSEREKIWAASGTRELWGVVLHELDELGTTRTYNTLFEAFAPASVAHGSGTFDNTDEILIGFDLSRDGFIRVIAEDADSGATFVTKPDNQFFLDRQDKIGVWGSMETGFVCVDVRNLCALIV